MLLMPSTTESKTSSFILLMMRLNLCRRRHACAHRQPVHLALVEEVRFSRYRSGDGRNLWFSVGSLPLAVCVCHGAIEKGERRKKTARREGELKPAVLSWFAFQSRHFVSSTWNVQPVETSILFIFALSRCLSHACYLSVSVPATN